MGDGYEYGKAPSEQVPKMLSNWRKFSVLELYEISVRHTAKHNDIGFFLSGSDFQANMMKNAVTVILDPYKDIFSL